MDWYEKLNTYFPAGEMKSKAQLDALLSDKDDNYIKDEGPYHIIMYAEFNSFIFIDFLWVSEKSRGKGIGKQLIEKLKAKNKTIILEVEPINPNDQDTEKRLRFYDRAGFKHAIPIVYWFQSFVANEEMQLEIMYWNENDVADRTIYEAMKQVYEQIHVYKAKELYGTTPKPTGEVIRFKY